MKMHSAAEVDRLWNYADPAASEAAFRGALPAARGGDADAHAQLLSQLARSVILQRRFDEGFSLLDEAERLLSEATPAANVRIPLERGRACNDLGRNEEAAACFQEAFERARTAGLEALAVDAAHMLGVAPPDEAAIGWNEKALEIARSSDDPAARRWIGTLWMNQGVRLQRLSRLPEAEGAFRASLAAFEEAGNAPRVRLAKLCLAQNRRLQGDPAGALPEVLAVQQAMQAGGDHLGWALEEQAECLLALDRPADAVPVFAAAYDALSTYPWFPPNEPARLERLRTLGGRPPGKSD